MSTKKETFEEQIVKTLESISSTLKGCKKETEAQRMANMWVKVKSDLYEKGLDNLDATAKSLVGLSSALVTVGFTVIGGMVGSSLLDISLQALWIASLGFIFFMLSTILSILVIFRWKFNIHQLAEAYEITSEWARIRDLKFQFLKWAYVFFGIGVIIVTFSIFSQIFFG